jgi:RNA polymerase sigma-70 factor (ECF subfamily)
MDREPTRNVPTLPTAPATLSVRTVTKLLDVMENDQLTVQRALSGDQAAMRSLWARHAPHIDVVVRRLVGQDMDLAADIAQEVWIQIFRALPSFRGDAQFGTWAHRIAVNRTLNALRRTRRLAAIEVEVEDDTASVEPDVERSFLAASIEEAAAKLSPGARTVFLLHDVEGYTHEEIAAELGITSGGSKSQLFKARAKLRRLLAHLVDAPARAPGRPTPVTSTVTSPSIAEHAAPLC